MKRKLTIAISIVSLVLIFCTYVSLNNREGIKVSPLEIPGNGESDDFDKTNLKVKSNITFDETASVYKFKQSKADENFVKNVAKTFNIDINKKIDDTGDNLIIEDNNGRLLVEKATSMWSYERKLNEQAKSTDKIVISDDSRVIEIAKRELAKYKLSTSSFFKPIVSYKTETVAGETDSKILAKDIYFYKSFNGKPVIGTSRIIVSIGNNDEILSISKYYREVEETAYKVKLKKRDDMLNEIKNNKTLALYNGKDKIPGNIEITSVELCYWEDSSNGFLQPVYVMKGSDTKNVSYVFSAYVPAVVKNQTVK